MKYSIIAGVASITLALSAPVVSAQEMLVAEYLMQADTHDMYNSNGVRLNSFCQIVQQDRANFHRFGKPGPMDQYDSVFHDANNRMRIPQTCVVVGQGQRGVNNVMSGQPDVFSVKVYVQGGVISTVLIE
ncbi:hypothetical protein [Antarctobacter jejuensis]|uniref:hypothetical protein n=1 Tax=Antarctobacter jejuensis TaxID=1439938 RepID=UPI003FCF3A50